MKFVMVAAVTLLLAGCSTQIDTIPITLEVSGSSSSCRIHYKIASQNLEQIESVNTFPWIETIECKQGDFVYLGIRNQSDQQLKVRIIRDNSTISEDSVSGTGSIVSIATTL